MRSGTERVPRLWPLATLAAVLMLPGLPARAQQEDQRAHMEGCLKWQSVNDGYAAFNQCDSPIVVKFMMLADQRVIEGDAPPHGRFVARTSLRGKLIFTACPSGYEPSLRFAAANAEAIAVSLYNCVAGRPNS